MDTRTEPFLRKFMSAQKYLGAETVQNIISLKYRDDCVSGSDYARLIDDYLTRTLGLNIKRVDGDFWGQAWLIEGRHRSKAIIVQHETGLEILYVVGSIASLIALIPMISSGWTRLRDRFQRHPLDSTRSEDVEIRRFDQNNTLLEDHAPSVEVYTLNVFLHDNIFLTRKVHDLEEQVARLKKTVGTTKNRRLAGAAQKKKSTADKRVHPTRSPRRAPRG